MPVWELTSILSIRNTNNFKYVPEDELLFKGICARNKAAYVWQGFLDFIEPYIDKNIYIEIMEKTNMYKENVKSSRGLPNLTTLIRFDAVMDKFLFTGTNEELIYYFPVIIWWKIAGVYPLRTTEVCGIRFNCIKKETQKFWLEIPCAKKKFSSDFAYDWVPISEYVYGLIEFYKKNTPEDRDRLLSSYQYRKKISQRQVVNYPALTNENLANILRDFINNICITRFGETVREKDGVVNWSCMETIQLGDLRHFAAYNAIMQGFDPEAVKNYFGMKKSIHSGIITRICNLMPTVKYLFCQIESICGISLEYLAKKRKQVFPLLRKGKWHFNTLTIRKPPKKKSAMPPKLKTGTA